MPARATKVTLYDSRKITHALTSNADIYDIAITRLVANSVALAIGTKEEYLLGPSRGAHALALGRQTMQYLMHVTFGMDYTRIGYWTNRDRTSVSYACGRIEEYRDNLSYDKALFFAELALREMAQGSLNMHGGEPQ